MVQQSILFSKSMVKRVSFWVNKKISDLFRNPKQPILLVFSETKLSFCCYTMT